MKLSPDVCEGKTQEISLPQALWRGLSVQANEIVLAEPKEKKPLQWLSEEL